MKQGCGDMSKILANIHHSDMQIVRKSGGVAEGLSALLYDFHVARGPTEPLQAFIRVPHPQQR